MVSCVIYGVTPGAIHTMASCVCDLSSCGSLGLTRCTPGGALETPADLPQTKALSVRNVHGGNRGRTLTRHDSGMVSLIAKPGSLTPRRVQALLSCVGVVRSNALVTCVSKAVVAVATLHGMKRNHVMINPETTVPDDHGARFTQGRRQQR